MWMSTVQSDRKRLISPGGIIGFGAVMAFALVAVFPRGTLEHRLLEGGGGDALTVAYLEAWLRADPNNADVIEHLTREYLSEHRFGDAERLVSIQRASPDADVRRRALLVDIDIAERRLYTLADADRGRARQIEQLDGLLNTAAHMAWSPEQLQMLAVKALALNDGALAARYYHRLAAIDPARASYWLSKESAAQLAGEHYREAADAAFAAESVASSTGEKRKFFFAGLRALQGGNLLDDALKAARAHIGPLASDPLTLRFLVRLALSAGRPDLAADYTMQLLRVRSRASDKQAASAFEFTRWRTRAPSGIGFAIWHAGDRPHVVRVAQASDTTSPGQTSRDELGRADDELAFRVFVANGRLGEAADVARAVLAREPDSIPWHERLAQVATWNNEPHVALDAYFWLARTRNDEASWQQVLRLAPALQDDRALLAALQHESNQARSDTRADRQRQLEWIDKFVAAEERLADPRAGMEFLASHARGALRRPVLERYAALAERAGNDELALQTWQTLERDFGPEPAYALKIAITLYGQGRFPEALSTLESAKNVAAARPKDTEDFWRFYAALGRIVQRPPVIVEASRHLLASGRETSGDLDQMIDALDAQPLDAGRVAEFAFRRTGELRDLQLAVYHYTRAHAFGRVAALFDSLTPEQRTQVEREPAFLLARSQYWQYVDEPARALQDVRAALRHDPDNAEASAAFVWLLNDQGSETELRAVLRSYRFRATNDPALAGAFAAAYLRLGDARAALHYLRLNAQSRGDDPLWQLSVADARELNGQIDEAWRVRRSVWATLHRQQINRTKPSQYAPDEYNTLRVRFIALTDHFAGSDASRHLLIELLREDTQADAAPSEQVASELGDLSMLPPATAKELTRRTRHYSAAAREAVLAWSQSHNAYGFERDWLEWHYAQGLSRPSYASAAIALADNDPSELSRLLDDPSERLPLQTKIAAELQTGRIEAAQRDAFEAQSLLPDNDLMHATLVDAILPTAQAIAPGFRVVHEGPLSFVEGSLAAGIRITPTLSFAFRYTDRAQHGDDSLPGVPGHDRRFEAVLRRFGTDDRETLVVGRRSALVDLTTLRLEGSFFDKRPLSFSFALGRNQEATESAQLQVGGVKDNLVAAVSFRPDPHIFSRARVEYDRFYGQDRSYLGHGTIFDIDAGYKLRSDYPDYSIRVVFTHGQYSANGTPGALLQRLVPDGTPFSAQQFVPNTFTQAALLVGFGNGLMEGYSHAWRPFIEAGPLRDSRAGWGERVTAGVVGSVFGADQLGFYVTHSSASQNHSTPVTEVGVHYRWMY
jgi:polysaccharide biosynthesis protein PelB